MTLAQKHITFELRPRRNRAAVERRALNELLGTASLVLRPNDLPKFTGVYYAVTLQELKNRPRLTLKDGAAVAEELAVITENLFLRSPARTGRAKALKTRATLKSNLENKYLTLELRGGFGAAKDVPLE